VDVEHMVVVLMGVADRPFLHRASPPISRPSIPTVPGWSSLPRSAIRLRPRMSSRVCSASRSSPVRPSSRALSRR
jgi:hypothetical protein